MGLVKKVHRTEAGESEAGHLKKAIFKWRTYAVLGAFLTTVFTILIWQDQSDYHRIIQAIFAMAYLSVLAGSYWSTSMQRNLSNTTTLITILLTYYVCINAFAHDFNTMECFSFFLLLFITSIILENRILVHIYFLSISAMTVVFVLLTKHNGIETGVSENLVLGFTLTYSVLGFFVINRKVNEKEETESRELFLKNIFNNTYDAILLVDYYSREVMDCNDVALRIFNVKDKGEIIGHKRDRFQVNKMNAEQLVKCRKELKETGKWTVEEKYRTADGKEFWADIVITPMNTRTHQYYIVRLTDISRRKETQLELLRSEERYRTLFERNLAGVFKIELDGKVLECNNAYARMLGLADNKELVGRTMDQYYFSTEERASYTKTLKNKSVLTNHKLRHRRKDGSELWVLESVSLMNRDDSYGDHLEGTAIDITELEKATTQLREKENRISLIINNIDSLVYSVNVGVDYPEHIAFLSDQVEDILGYRKEDIESGKVHLIQHVHHDDLEKIRRGREMLKKSHRKEVFLYRIKHGKTGKYIWLEESVFPQPDGGEGPKNFGLIKDVTERVNAELELKKSEEKSKEILENVEEVIYNVSIDESGKKSVEYVSPQLESLMGFKREDYLKMIEDGRIKHHFHEDDWPEIVTKSRLLKETGKTQEMIYRFRPPGADHYRWFEERVFPKFEDGRHVGNLGVTRDITEKIEVDIALKESEKRFKLLADSTLEGIVFSVDNVIIDANDQFVAMHGYSDSSEVIGMSIFDFLVEELHERTKAYMKQPNPTLPMESMSRRKDGSSIYVETKGKNIPLGDSVVRVSVVSDISKRKSYEMELERTKEYFKHLVEASPDGIIIQEREKILYINPAGLEILGLQSADEAIEQNELAFIPKKYHKEIEKRWNQLDQGKEVPFFEMEIETPAGLRCIESKPTKIIYEDKDVYQVVLHDISERKLYEREQLRTAIAERTNRLLKQEIQERAKAEKQLLKNQAYTRQLIDSSLDIIFAADKSGNLTEFNKAAEATFGYRKKKIIGTKSAKLFHSKEQYRELIRQLFEGKGLFSGELACKSRSKEEFFAYLSASILRDEDGKILGYMAVGRDITEIRKAEQELIASEKKYRDLFENATDLIQSVDEKGRIVFVNNAWLENLGYDHEECEGKPVFDFLHPDSLDHCKKQFKDLLINHESRQVEFAYISRNGHKVEVSGTLSARLQAGGGFATRGMFRNVTQEKQNRRIQDTFTEVARVLTQAGNEAQMFTGVWRALNSSLDASNFYVSLFDPQSETLSFVFYIENGRPQKKALVQRQGEHGLTEYVAKLKAPVLFDKDQLLTHLKKNKVKIFGNIPEAYVAMPLLIKRKSIGVIAAQNYSDRKAYDKTHSTILEMISTPLALTIQRFRDEAALRTSLSEKEVLLKEVHHRVKNNLQIISSILNLQSSYTQDKKILELLQDSQNRIKSMAYIHESLYQTSDFSNVSFKSYLQTLSSGLIQSYSLIHNPVMLRKELEEVSLNLDQAIPCGLIMNELIINAIKYAFTNKKKGVISISLRSEDKKVSLRISDNGIGLPKSIDFDNIDTLGLQLVKSLVDQIDGELIVKRNKGTEFIINFIAD